LLFLSQLASNCSSPNCISQVVDITGMHNYSLRICISTMIDNGYSFSSEISTPDPRDLPTRLQCFPLQIYSL
jgi:hypothetical protein